MEKKIDLTETIKGMDDAGLNALENAIKAARASKRIKLEDIRVGMSPEETARARADINALLRELDQ